MTKINVTTREAPIDCSPIEVGQYYCDTSKYGGKKVYLVVEVEELGAYMAVNINTGASYNGQVKDINKVFGPDRKDFTLVKQIDIAVFY